MSLRLIIASLIPKPESTTDYYDIDIPYDASLVYEAAPKIDGKEYKIGLVGLSFNKQMYQPGEILARLHITQAEYKTQGDDKSYFLMTQKVLNGYFLGRQTKLQDDKDNVIAQDYFVYEVIPEYTPTSLYVDLKIYSPDKLLTLGNFCRSFVARRLGADIITTELDNYSIPYSNGTIPFTSALRNKLLNGTSDEYIQPYLVQYNESFYDLIARTANRWGEFFYFEDGQLILGRKQFKKTDTSNNEVDDNKVVSTYHSASYCAHSADPITVSLSQRNTTQPNKLNGTTTHTSGLQKDTVTQDDYLNTIKINSYIPGAADAWHPDEFYGHHILQSILGMKGNFFDWSVDRLIDDNFQAGQNLAYLQKKEGEYNKKYFEDPRKDSSGNAFTSGSADDVRTKAQYDSNTSIYCQFGTYSSTASGLRAADYADVITNELTAEKQMICIDLDANYQHLRLGDLFAFGQKDAITSYPYMVVRVEGVTDDKEVIKMNDNDGTFYIDKEHKLHFRVWAVQQIKSGVFYPAMIPSGHVRFSGPQSAIIKDTFDPEMNNRYRVKYTWQADGDEASPWLPVAQSNVWNKTGSTFQLSKDVEVLLNYEDGNIERPYIMGAMPNQYDKVGRMCMFNVMNFTTPAGHAIRLHDGYGAGTANFLANMFPLAGLIKGFAPEASAFYGPGGPGRENKDPFYEGGMSLTDQYGVYSISASTDNRNITIKSPYGDIALNAFTGITINAPNGDVSIRGKNVSIEAGNNLKLRSGLNVTNGFLGSGVLPGRGGVTGSNIGADIGKAFGNKCLSYVDLSLLRHTLEVFLRPIAGEMTLKANRHMTIWSGLMKDESVEKSIKKSLSETWEDITQFFDEDVLMRDSDRWDDAHLGDIDLVYRGHYEAGKEPVGQGYQSSFHINSAWNTFKRWVNDFIDMLYGPEEQAGGQESDSEVEYSDDSVSDDGTGSIAADDDDGGEGNAILADLDE